MDIDPDDLPEPEAGGNMPPEGMGELDDVDKAGAVYDAALDAKRWCTSKNGKHFEFDTETGEVTKGYVGQPGYSYQSMPLESTQPDTAHYEALVEQHGGDHKRAAHEYYRENLQGRHVTAQTDSGPVDACFTGGGWNEIKKDMSRDAAKAALVPHMPDIISTGRYAPEAPAHDHPDVSRFHTYRKTVKTAEGPREVIVDVAERSERKPSQAGHQVYSLTREGTSAYETRQKESASLPGPPGRNRGGQDTPNQDSNAVVDEKIAPTFEVVNIRFAGER